MQRHNEACAASVRRRRYFKIRRIASASIERQRIDAQKTRPIFRMNASKDKRRHDRRRSERFSEGIVSEVDDSIAVPCNTMREGASV